MAKKTKIMLVTGASDGIGKATALELARRGALVILHGRSLERLEQTQEEIASQVPGAQTEIVLADLASLEQVRGLALEVEARFDRLDVLIHNAGVFMKERQLSADGFEMTLAVNHLAPFLLTWELLPLLEESAARVVTVSSVAHRRGQIDFDDLNAEKSFDGYRAYAQSKLANILFANELAAITAGKMTSNSLHPGVITTKLLKAGFDTTGADPASGAATSVYLATSPEVEKISGKYFSDSRLAPLAPQALDLAAQKKLWEISENWTRWQDQKQENS
ncbi:MAG: SDR family oxidoreductase [Anaerolineales bacterium]